MDGVDGLRSQAAGGGAGGGRGAGFRNERIYLLQAGLFLVNEISRLDRLGVKAPAEAVACAIRTIAAEAQERHSRVLRVELSVVTPDPRRSRAIAEATAVRLVPRIPPDRIYERTAMMDLTTGDAGPLLHASKENQARHSPPGAAWYEVYRSLIVQFRAPT